MISTRLRASTCVGDAIVHLSFCAVGIGGGDAVGRAAALVDLDDIDAPDAATPAPLSAFDT